jgi:predicted O-methyltransferase YrrM
MGLSYNKINRFFADKFNFVVLRRFPRHSTRFAKKHFRNRGIVAVEIGTLERYNARSILKELNVKKLYVVDPYENYSDYASSEPETVKKLKWYYRTAKKRLSRYADKVVWIKKLSDDALDDVPKDVDFVYIDGNHEYEYVKRDMENYFKKLKKGGVLAGHDIASFPGVGEALVEFCSERKIKPRITVTDWWVVKE